MRRQQTRSARPRLGRSGPRRLLTRRAVQTRPPHLCSIFPTSLALLSLVSSLHLPIPRPPPPSRSLNLTSRPLFLPHSRGAFNLTHLHLGCGAAGSTLPGVGRAGG